MRYRHQELGYPLKDLYRVVGITEQAVFQHRKRQEHYSLATIMLLRQMDVYRREHPGCGLEKMYYQIEVLIMGRDKFIEFGKAMGYQLKHVRSKTITTIPGCYRWPNIIQGMLVMNINVVWQSDITYFRVDSRFYYITFVLDVYSRKIVGYAVSNTLEAKANVAALKFAFKTRGDKRQCDLIHHSDRGTQYTSTKYLAMLSAYGCTPSMGEKGQDNAYAERLNGIIKNEYLIYRRIANLTQLKKWVKQAVDQYNSTRIHDSLPEKLSPNAFEEKLLTLNYQKRPKVIIYADGRHTEQHAEGMLLSLPEEALKAHICPI